MHPAVTFGYKKNFNRTALWLNGHMAGATNECGGSLDARARIVTYVKTEPGCCIRAIAESLGIDWSTAEYHLRILCRERDIVERRAGNRRLFFPPEAAPKSDDPAMLSSACRRVFDQLIHAGPSCASELAVSLSIARTGVLRHIDKLTEHGLVEREREGRRVLFAPIEGTADKGLDAPVHMEHRLERD